MKQGGHNPNAQQSDQNKSTAVSGSGGRKPRPEGSTDKAPKDDPQDQSITETFEEEGAGIAAKE